MTEEQYGCCVFLFVFFLLCQTAELPLEAWLTKALQGLSGDEGERGVGGRDLGLSWAMDALSITAALAGGPRSRHVVVRERWSVRSQHSLTTPDPSSGQEQHRVCLRGDSQENGFFHSGQRAMCWPEEKGCKKKEEEETPVEMISFGRIWGINTIKGGFWSRTLQSQIERKSQLRRSGVFMWTVKTHLRDSRSNNVLPYETVYWNSVEVPSAKHIITTCYTQQLYTHKKGPQKVTKGERPTGRSFLFFTFIKWLRGSDHSIN